MDTTASTTVATIFAGESLPPTCLTRKEMTACDSHWPNGRLSTRQIEASVTIIQNMRWLSNILARGGENVEASFLAL
jgi:hypothetical protein